MDGAEFVPEPDPFGNFSSLFDLDPLDLGGEGPRSGIARRDEEGDWNAEVPAVAVTTDHGRILLEAGREVDVRIGTTIQERLPEQLRPGDVLLVGRRAGRVGLLAALEERLAHRPDLLAARLLIDGYHELVRTRFLASGLTIAELHRRLVAAGCDKTSRHGRELGHGRRYHGPQRPRGPPVAQRGPGSRDVRPAARHAVRRGEATA